MLITAAAGFTAKHNPYQPHAVTLSRGNKIKAGSVGIAGFDAVCPLEGFQKPVMIFEFKPVPVKLGTAEIMKILRKITSDSHPKTRHIARCTILAAVGEARGIPENGSAHPK